MMRLRQASGVDEGAAAAYALTKAQQMFFAQLLQRRFDAFASSRNRFTAHAFTPVFASMPIFGEVDVKWRTWLSDPLFALLKVTEKWTAVRVQEGLDQGSGWATQGDTLGRAGEGGSHWERRAKRTSGRI